MSSPLGPQLASTQYCRFHQHMYHLRRPLRMSPTATQLLNSGSRSPNDALAVGAISSRRHDSDSSLYGCRRRLLCMMHDCKVFARELQKMPRPPGGP